jgi:Skp family chaperone for outer membrane proteins
MSDIINEKPREGQATISTHNGHNVKWGHNRRDRRITDKEPHIDPTKPHFEWIDQKVEKAYQDIFGATIKAYNDRQTRQDRKILDYYSRIQNDPKKHPVYEMIVGVYPGLKADGSHELSEIQIRHLLKEYVDGWQARNPNLALIGAYYHADERGKEPHVHLDYIPVARGYAKGPSIQNGLDRALNQQGLITKGKNTAQIQWEARENQVFEDLVRSRTGLEVIHPQRTGVKKKHLAKLDYIIAQKEEEAQEAQRIARDTSDQLLSDSQDLARIRRKKAQEQKELDEIRQENAQERAWQAKAQGMHDEYAERAIKAAKKLNELVEKIDEKKNVLKFIESEIRLATANIKEWSTPYKLEGAQLAYEATQALHGKRLSSIETSLSDQRLSLNDMLAVARQVMPKADSDKLADLLRSYRYHDTPDEEWER